MVLYVSAVVVESHDILFHIILATVLSNKLLISLTQTRFPTPYNCTNNLKGAYLEYSELSDEKVRNRIKKSGNIIPYSLGSITIPGHYHYQLTFNIEVEARTYDQRLYREALYISSYLLLPNTTSLYWIS